MFVNVCTGADKTSNTSNSFLLTFRCFHSLKVSDIIIIIIIILRMIIIITLFIINIIITMI